MSSVLENFSKPAMRTAPLALLLTATLPFTATALEGISFDHKDWILACDNTGTCRAAGYQEENQPGLASLLLERRAGTNTQVQASLKLGEDAEFPTTVELHIGAQALGPIALDHMGMGKPNPAQTRALLTAIKGTAAIELRASDKTWTLSSSGANAVLLKMDEFQRRVGTTSALIRPGKQRGNPLLPQAASVIYAAAVPQAAPRTISPANADYPQLQRLLGQALQEACFPEKDEPAPSFVVHALSDSRALISTTCWMAAYNHGDIYVLMDSDSRQVLKVLGSDFNDYANGVLSSSHKGRGLGDCWSTKEYVWDGQQFVLSLKQTTGLCRGFPGGAWELPTVVSEVR
ncbi:hypothetical protein CO614_00010 [Lysobacteraceae bacterium NML120232]|nr:hypothetical protein CO614_00010 [Xanthomonadaceae bacterium NML120232]